MSLLSLALSLTTFTAPAALEARITTALGAPVGAPGGLARPIDPRLRLPDCPAGPTVVPAPDGLSVSAVVAEPRSGATRQDAARAAGPSGGARGCRRAQSRRVLAGRDQTSSYPPPSASKQ